MTASLATVEGVALLAIPLTLLGFGLLRLVDLRQKGHLEQGIMSMMIHEDRRARFRWEALTMACAFLVAGVLSALQMIVGSSNAYSFGFESAIFATFLVGGLALLAMIWDGVRPRVSLSEEMELRRLAPKLAETFAAPEDNAPAIAGSYVLPREAPKALR